MFHAHLPSRPRSFARAFTLIELLVVVAIIALLIAILLPSLATARHERTKAVMCAANMRSMGQIINIFNNEHDGRGPGGGTTADSSSSSTFGVAWQDVLNFDTMAQNIVHIAGNGYYNNPTSIYGIMELQTASDYAGYVSKRHMLVCPNYIPAGDYHREFALNYDATGGPGARYGLYVDAHTGDPGDPNFFNTGSYYLGAQYGHFNPGQILMIENDYEDTILQGNGYNPEVHNNPTGKVTVNDNPAYPSCDGMSGEFSFRHAGNKKGNFLYFDFHVDQLGPKENINSDVNLTIQNSGYAIGS